VLELPNSALGSKRVGLWARHWTAREGLGAGRPGLPRSGLFVGWRGGYLNGRRDRCSFIDVFAHAMEHTGGYGPEEQASGAGNTAARHAFVRSVASASFEQRRTLTECRRRFLAVLTNGKVTETRSGAHTDLLAEFPYLGPPHNTSARALNFTIATEAKASRVLALHEGRTLLNDLRKVLYTAKAHTTGGAHWQVATAPTAASEVTLSRPVAREDQSEAVFAGSACFESDGVCRA